MTTWKRHIWPGALERFPTSEGNAGVFQELEDRMESAKSNARLALSDVEATARYDPSTEVHCLVEYLQTLKPT